MEQGEDRYWRRTSSLMWTMLALWVFFSFVIHFFVNQLNSIEFLGFPLGFYMAAQGSLIAFVVMLFVYASVQDKIDREEGVAEDMANRDRNGLQAERGDTQTHAEQPRGATHESQEKKCDGLGAPLGITSDPVLQ